MKKRFSPDIYGGSGVIPASAVVLGGGMGRRIGGNKLFLAAEGVLVLERVVTRLSPWFGEIILAVGPDDCEPLDRLLSPAMYRRPLRVVVDSQPGRGPLEGLAAGLGALRTEWAFVVGCDMPWVQEAVVRSLWRAKEIDSNVICARLNGYLEPLHAFYSVHCLPEVRKALAEDRRRLKSFYDDVKVTVVEEEYFRALPGYRRSFRGINTPEDLQQFVNPDLP